MNEIVHITIDEQNEMLSIVNSNGETIFYGNYWDFDVPDDIIAVLDSINCISTVVSNTDMMVQ